MIPKNELMGRRTKAHYLNCHTRLGLGHSLMPLVLDGACAAKSVLN